MANQLCVISPYYDITWVFDDESTGLVREPFVSGMPEMLDHFTRDIPDAHQGFRLTFSGDPFPGHQETLHRVREEGGGWWYRTENPAAEGWLCPALFCYFDRAPERIYIKAEPKQSPELEPKAAAELTQAEQLNVVFHDNGVSESDTPGMAEILEVIKLADGMYVLLETPMLTCRAHIGDTIRTETDADGVVHCRDVFRGALR